MNLSFQRVLIFTMLVILTPTPQLLAGGSYKSKKSAVAAPIDTRFLVQGIDVRSGTLEIKHMRDAKSPPTTYRVDALTELTVNGARSTLDKVTVGMQVVDFVERDFDTLDRLRVCTATALPTVVTKKPTKKKK